MKSAETSEADRTMSGGLDRWWGERTLTTKMLLLMAVVFSAAWLIIDRIQSQRIWDLLQKHQHAMLEQEGMEDRLRLDNFTRSINHAAKLMIHLEGFKRHLQRMEEQDWVAHAEFDVVRYDQRPPWLPRKFLLRGLANAKHVLLLDPEMRVREVFQNGPQPLSREIEAEIADFVSPDGEIYLAFFNNLPQMVVPGILRDNNQIPRAFLVFLVPLDEQFLFTFQRKAAGKSVVAFLDRDSSLIFASSRPELVPAGANLQDLGERFLIVTDRFLDFGFAADTEIEFAVLTPWEEVDEITKRMIASERPMHLVTALILITVLALILQWITWQLRQFSNQMLDFSRQQLGLDTTIKRKGDQLNNVQEQFFTLGTEIKRVRAEEQKQAVELLAVNKELESHRLHLAKMVQERTEDLNRTNVSLRQEVEERRKAENHTKRTLQSRNVISGILQASFEPISLGEQLSRALRRVLELEWLSVTHKGTIFLLDDGGDTLSMIAHAGVTDVLVETCSKIEVGHCLCGQAALSRKIVFANSLDDRHQIHYDGIQPHGHYCVPILSSGELLGVLNLYLVEGQSRDQEQEEFLQAVADTMASIIVRKRVEAEIRVLNIELEKRVEERTAELTAANKEMESFSYSVSHDLRAPLRTIDGFSEILMEDCAVKLNEEERVFLENIRDGIREMNALINGLLMLSRLTRGEMSKDELDLSLMAQSIIDDHKTAAPERVVVADIMPKVTAVGDPSLVKTLMENLIGNAWKYSGASPEVQIAFGMEEKDGDHVYFVKDGGAGFDMAYYDKLFQPFQRLHSVERFEGSGIGLATVQRIVKRHGGSVWAESEVGKGATFYFTLAAAQESP